MNMQHLEHFVAHLALPVSGGCFPVSFPVPFFVVVVLGLIVYVTAHRWRRRPRPDQTPRPD